MPTWFDRFGQEWAQNGYTDDPTNAQANAGWAYIGQAPPTVEQFNSISQWNDNKDNYLYGQIANVITKAGMTIDYADLTQLYRAIMKLTGKLQMITDTTFYLSPIGNDLNDGLTPGTAWATINHAWNWIRDYVASNGFQITMHLADGSYSQCELKGYIGSLPPIIQGNTANRSAVIVNGASGPAFMVWQGAVVILDSIQAQAVGNTGDYVASPDGIQARTAGYVIIRNMVFGTCTTGGSHMEVRPFGHITMGQTGGRYTINGPADTHLFINQGVIANGDTTVTISNNPAIGTFCWVTNAGMLQGWNTTYNGSVAAGCVRYNIDFNGTCRINSANAAYFPGSIAGTVSSATGGVIG